MTGVSREKENEQLRLKMDRLKESLRLRKEKMMIRSNRASAAQAAQAAGGGGPVAGPSQGAPQAQAS